MFVILICVQVSASNVRVGTLSKGWMNERVGSLNVRVGTLVFEGLFIAMGDTSFFWNGRRFIDGLSGDMWD